MTALSGRIAAAVQTCDCPTDTYRCLDGVIWGPCLHSGNCPERDEDGEESIAWCACGCHTPEPELDEPENGYDESHAHEWDAVDAWGGGF